LIDHLRAAPGREPANAIKQYREDNATIDERWYITLAAPPEEPADTCPDCHGTGWFTKTILSRKHRFRCDLCAAPPEEAQPAEDDYRTCEFCGCWTNAKQRFCCDKGRDADRAPPAVQAMAQALERSAKDYAI